MKKLILLSIFSFLAISFLHAQEEEAGNLEGIKAAKVKDLEGNWTNTSEFSNDGKPIIISFWATWCKPCVLELNTIADEYEDWQDETGVKLIAISIDDARNARKVAPFVNGKAWEYEVFIDENQDFKRVMGVNNVPHTFLIDGEGKVVYQHNSFAPGDEEELYEMLLEHSGEE